MKPRNKEVNIFNMSLLDVLCGALGAFCFMMLVLLPSYTTANNRAKAPELPPDFDPKNYQEALQRIKQLESSLDEYKNYADKLDRQNSQARNQVDQLQKQVDQLNKENDVLSMRNPVIAIAGFNIAAGDTIQMWVEDLSAGDDQKPPGKLDLTKIQDPHWIGDMRFAAAGMSVTYYMVRDAPRTHEFRISLKVIRHDTAAGAMQGWVSVNGFNEQVWIPSVKINSERVAVPVAQVKIGADNKQKMQQIVPKEYLPQ